MTTTTTLIESSSSSLSSSELSCTEPGGVKKGKGSTVKAALKQDSVVDKKKGKDSDVAVTASRLSITKVKGQEVKVKGRGGKVEHSETTENSVTKDDKKSKLASIWGCDPLGGLVGLAVKRVASQVLMGPRIK